MSNVLIITGMHRSGTSLTAACLQTLGIDVGENLLAGDVYNARGYFEDADFVALQRSMLQACCNREEAGWQDWGWTESETFDRTQLDAYLEVAKSLIEQRCQQARSIWGWKDPRTSLLLDFWHELLPEARYLLVYRSPWDVVDSIVRLKSLAFHQRPHFALRIWGYYNYNLLSFYLRHPHRCLLVNINSILAHPQQFIEKLAHKLHLKTHLNCGDRFSNIYHPSLFHQLNEHHPLISTIVQEYPQSINLLSRLEHTADLPGSQAIESMTNALKKIRDPVILPLSLASQTPDIQSMNSTNSNPQISVIIPCYNQGEFILEAISSVQSCQSRIYEIIIVNDCSTDPLTQKVLNYLKQKNYHIIDHLQNQGLSAARNTGIEQAKADYVLPLDADNKIKPEYMLQAIEILDKHPEVGVVYGDMQIFGDKDAIRDVPDFDFNLLVKGNYIDACAVLRKQVWQDCGGYDANIPHQLGYEDWDLWLTAAEKGWEFYHIPEVLFFYRYRVDSMVSRCNIPENRKQLIRYICAKHLDLYTTNFIEVLATKESDYLVANAKAELLEVKLNETQRYNQRLERDLEDVHTQLYDARIDGQKAHDRLFKLTEEVQQTHEKLHEAVTNVQDTHAQLNEARLEIHNVHERLNQAISEIQQAHAQLHESRVDAQQAHDQLNAALVEIPQVHQRLHQAQLIIQELREVILGMESSKFWKLRILWFKLKSPGAKLKQLFEKRHKFLEVAKTQGWKTAVKKVVRKVQNKLNPTAAASAPIDIAPEQLAYQHWMGIHAPRAADLRRMADTIPTFRYQPTISIIMPVYNTPEKFLRDAIQSVLNQAYPYWELCIADDASTATYIKPLLEEYAAKDARIKLHFRSENGHISRASNSAIELATGDYIALLDHDDLITPDALYEVVLSINQHPDADMIYSDEDKADEHNNIMHPFFKPDWCPDSFLTRMYTCHFGVYRRSVIDEIGGFRVGYEGSQDYDLVLRFTEKTDKIYHIPKILYHWRIHAESTASGGETVKTYAYDAAKKAITEAIYRRGEPGRVLDVPGFLGSYTVRYDIKDYKRVSIIIPTRDLAGLLDRCLESIFTQTTYPNYEVIVVDNGSVEPETAALFARWTQQEPDRFKCYKYDIPFNYPKINNYGVEKATGDYLLLLNNDTQVLTPDWLEAMVEHVQRPSIGAVGALLLYSDDLIQHAGVIMGIGGIAGHSHRMFPKDTPGYVCQVKTVNNYSAVTGACLMCRREVFEEVGGLDETLAVAYNDVDFCLKIVDRGYRNLYIPHAVLYHYESRSRGYEDTPEKLERLAREGDIIRSRWLKYIEHDPCYNPHLTKDLENYSINLNPPQFQMRWEKAVADRIEVETVEESVEEITEEPTPEIAATATAAEVEADADAEVEIEGNAEVEIEIEPTNSKVATNGLFPDEDSAKHGESPDRDTQMNGSEPDKDQLERVRTEIADRYLRGKGIEIGALHSPLNVSSQAIVRYVDRMSVSALRLQYPELQHKPLVEVDIIDDGETLTTIEDNSQDFVIANHLIEHCQDPISTLQTYVRVIKPGGIVYLAVPDKRYTFDRDRPVTPLEHLIRDYKEGPEESKLAHFEEYVRMVDRVPANTLSDRLTDLVINLDYSIHFHVWTPDAFTEFLHYCQQEFAGAFAIELMQSNQSEFIAILRKTYA
jgi:O-antigen biosynthesis protein